MGYVVVLESDKASNFLQVRPVVETGYENLLLVRLLLESRIPSIRKSSVGTQKKIQVSWI